MSLAIVFVISMLYQVSARAQEQLPPFDEMVILAPLPLSHESHTIKRNSSVHESLVQAGIDPQMIHDIVKVARPQFNLRHIQPGTQYTISKLPDGTIRRVSFDISPLSRLEIIYSHEEWNADITELQTTKKLVHYSGVIEDSLWNSGMKAKLSPEVIVDFAEVFGWQVDFTREVRKGDTWRFTVEKLFADGQAVGWGNIIFAEYINGSLPHQAFFYDNPDTGTRGYFDEKGESLRKVFLKSPIKFGRVTSHFSRSRFHPIHRRYKAHNGVDYGAPRGTPVRAIGDGRVRKIGRFGGSGNMIVLDHVAGYETKYLHLSRFQKGLRLGSKVVQGQVIGFVGSTGYATGPHLHFEMSRHRQLMDPLKVNLPSASPIPQQEMPTFLSHVQQLKEEVSNYAYEPVESDIPLNTVPLKTKNARME